MWRISFLQCASLDGLNSTLSHLQLTDSIIQGRVEAYSCKPVNDDKRLYRHLEFRYADDLEDYGPNDMPMVSPFGPLNMQASRKTLYYLISTLNLSFPDYDFSNVKPEQFSKQPHLSMVINSINVSLSTAGSAAADLLQNMWPSIDSEIKLNECDIYMFTPDIDSDPAEEEDGTIWSLHYFFYNKKLKRLVFFTCRCVSSLGQGGLSLDSNMRRVDDDDMFDSMDYDDDDDATSTRRKNKTHHRRRHTHTHHQSDNDDSSSSSSNNNNNNSASNITETITVHGWIPFEETAGQ